MPKTCIALALLYATFCATRPCLPQTPRQPPATLNTVASEDRIDINHASLDQLLKLPGMTPSWANRVIRFRPYRAKNDLLNQGVLPGSVYQRIKDEIIAHHNPS